MKEEIHHEYSDFIVCPKCGYSIKDSWEFDDSGENECCECGALYTYDRIITHSYTTKLKP